MARLRGPRSLGVASLVTLSLLGSKLGLPPKSDVVLVAAICLFSRVNQWGTETFEEARGSHLQMAYGSACAPLPAAAAGAVPLDGAFTGALLVLDAWP